MSNRSLSWALTAKLVDDQTGPLLKLARQNERVKDQVVKAEAAKTAAHREAAAKISGSIKTVGRSLDASGRDAVAAGRDFRQLSLAEQKAAVQSEKLAAEHLKLSTRTAKLGRDLDAARTKAQRHEQQLERSGRASGRAAAGMGTLVKRVAAVGAAYMSLQGIRDSISVTEELTKTTMGLAGNFGMATDEGSRWAAQLKVRGIETAKFNTGLNTLSKNITAVGDADRKRGKDIAKLTRTEADRVAGIKGATKAAEASAKADAKVSDLTNKSLGSQADAFRKLGLSTREVKAGKSDLYGFLFKVADGMEGMTSKTERNAVGLKLFGKQWQTLRPLLASGSKGLQEQLEMADKYGLTLEETSTKGLADQIAAQREWKFALLGVQATLGNALIPVMTEAAKKGAELTAKVRENWPEIKGEITPVIDAIEGVVVPMGKFVGQHPGLLKVAAAALAVGAAVKTIRFAGQITGATTLLTTFGRLRRAAAVVPEVAAGAGGATAAKRTLGSRAAGAATSPWTAAAAAAVAAPIIAGKVRNGKIVEQAAREFADEIAQRTRTGIKSGLRKPEASQLGQAQASADQARTKLQNLDTVRGGRPLSMFNDSFRKEYADAEKQAREASPRIVAAFAAGLKTKRFVDSRSLMDQFRTAFAGMPRVAQTTGAGAMVQMARSMEKEGRAPRGTVDRLLRDLKAQWGGLVPATREAGVKSTRELDRALSDRKLAAHAGDTVRKLGDQFDQLPRLAVRSVPGAVATLGAQLDELERIAKDKDAPAVMRAQARRALPGLRDEYSRTLSRLATRMGMSRDDARAWADSQVLAARRAGKGRADVDTLTSGVSALRTKMRGGVIDADDYRRALQRIRESGMSTLQSEMPQIPAAKSGGKKGGATGKRKRRGGLISRFAGGGRVDTLMSGGEEYLPPEVASRYPAGVLDSIAQIQAPHFARGGPVRRVQRYNLGGMIVPGPSDRDGTYVPAEDGGFVLTGHGRQLRDEMLGFRRGGALRRFASGGSIVRGKVSVFGPPLEAAGTTANGMSSAQAGIALNLAPGSDAGWNNATTNRWVKARQRFLVRIAGHQAILPMIDKGPAGRTGRAIDVTGAGARAMGLNPARFPTDARGTAQAVGKDGKASSSGSVIPTKVVVRRNVGKSDTRGGLLEDPYSLGLDAVGLWGSRAEARKFGGLGIPALREALEAQKDSYTREVRTAREEARTGTGRRAASGKLGKGSPGGTWLRPVGGVQSGAFGESRPGHMHAGVDLAVPIGTPVHATRPGRSLGPQSNPGGYGTYTSIQHAGGYLSLYGHMSSIAARAGQSVKRGQTIGRSGNTGRSSGPHVHFEVRRGGTPVNPLGLLGRAYRGGGRVARFARGGKVARPTKAMRTTLKSVRRSTSDANLDAFGEAIEAAGLQRLEAMRASLLREVRGGGDRQAISRLQAAISTIEVDIAGRIGERIQSATRSAAGWQTRRGKWEHAMAMEGVDMSSATGLQRTITTGQTYVQNEAPGERDDLVTARNRIKRELAQADTPAKRERLKTELDSTNGKIDELDTQVRATRVEVEDAKRALPQQLAAERVGKIDLSAAFAELTNSLDDDVAAAEALRSEYQRQLNDPALAKTPEAIAAAARGLKSANDSLRDLGRRQVDDRLDAEDALAKLTDDGGADDRVVALRREKFLTDRLEEAKAAADPNYADIASIGSALLAVRDGLKALDTTLQEQQARDDALADLLKQQVENQQKLLHGAAISRDAIASAIAAAANGWIGQTVTRGAATPSFSGSGVIS